jgi:hypothetical protein
LHEYFEDGALELYHLAEDPGERCNLVDDFPEKTLALRALLHDWRKRIQAPLPRKLNPMYDSEIEAMALAEF